MKSIKFDNDTFLDSSSITHNRKLLSDILYPIGSIYMSVNEIDPTNLFGGTWEQIKDAFLLACGDNHPSGSVGGEEAVTLDVSMIPPHKHNVLTSSSGAHSHSTQGRTSSGSTTPAIFESFTGTGGTRTVNVPRSGTNGAHNHTINESSVGGGLPHNNMPPYLAVYVWKRVS